MENLSDYRGLRCPYLDGMLQIQHRGLASVSPACDFLERPHSCLSENGRLRSEHGCDGSARGAGESGIVRDHDESASRLPPNNPTIALQRTKGFLCRH
jgi:hypothetical protein